MRHPTRIVVTLGILATAMLAVVLAQEVASGPPVRVDFEGSRAAPPVPSTTGAGGEASQPTTGPAVRLDFEGRRAMPPPPDAATEPPAVERGAPLRVDFEGRRAEPARVP